jgi:hypothetical protein
MIDTAALRRNAEAATKERWHSTGATVFALHGEPLRNRFTALVQGGRRDDAGWAELVANAAHIAACSPSVILALLDELDALRAQQAAPVGVGGTHGA